MTVSRPVWSVLRWSGLPFLLRELTQRDATTILCYHDPEPAALARHLAVLGTRYRFIPLRDFVEASLSGDTTALPRRALVVTIDDGYRGNMHVLDVLRQYSVVPTIFLASGVVGTNRRFWWEMVPDERERERLKSIPDPERVAALEALGHSETERGTEPDALTDAQVEVLKDAVDFQSHTVMHPILSRCTDERARDEIARSKTDLERRFELDIYALSYPNGSPADWGEREVDIARTAGYACALTTVSGVNDGRTDLFRLRRIVVPDDAGTDEIVVRTSTLLARLKRLLRFPRLSR
jgi:peptidoglycan/xylan/chitin deacetylase (PgdA/CDA1 family)